MKKFHGAEQVCLLSPSAEGDNPRNSEGAFLTLKNGEIIFVYSRFTGQSARDDAFSDLCLIRSTDGGRSFGEGERIVTCAGEGGVNVMSVSLMEMANGDAGLFYLVRTSYTQARLYLRRSTDGGRSWSDRVLCSVREGFFVMNNDRAVRLDSGRIVLPAASHASGWSGSPEGDARFFDSRSKVQFFLSDDDGASWRVAPGEASLSHSAASSSGLQEPGVVELAPDILYGWARTDLGRQWEFISVDGGEHWTPCGPSRFSSPCSPMSMKRDADGTLYAIWNPIPEYNGREEVEGVFTGGRTPLVIAASRDNFKTFTQPMALEDEEGRGFCYCAMHFTPDALLLAYCCGGAAERSCLAATKIVRIPRETLTEQLF